MTAVVWTLQRDGHELTAIRRTLPGGRIELAFLYDDQSFHADEYRDEDAWIAAAADQRQRLEAQGWTERQLAATD